VAISFEFKPYRDELLLHPREPSGDDLLSALDETAEVQVGEDLEGGRGLVSEAAGDLGLLDATRVTASSDSDVRTGELVADRFAERHCGRELAPSFGCLDGEGQHLRDQGRNGACRPVRGRRLAGVEESLTSETWQLPDGRVVSELFAEGWPDIQRTVRAAVRKWRRFDEDLLSPEAMLRLLTVAGSTSYTRRWWGQGRWAAICKAIVTDATAAGITLPAPYDAMGTEVFLRNLQEPDAISDEALAWLIDIPGGPDGPRGLRSHSVTNPIIREFELYVFAASDQPASDDSQEAP
jgi:hypothetical protein